MHAAELLMRERLGQLPRRFRMPPLPLDARAAAAAGTDCALAFSIETLRQCVLAGTTPPPEIGALFTRALAELVQRALQPDGDLAFQALVLRSEQAGVQEFLRLQPGQSADRRAVRSAVDAIAHPARPALGDASLQELLRDLHRCASAQDWQALRDTLERIGTAAGALPPPVQATIAALRTGGALQRLLRSAELAGSEPVRRWRALGSRQGPEGGSKAAAAHGRASAVAGEQAEQASGRAFAAVARWLGQQPGTSGRYQLARSLRPPAGFPGEKDKAKDEWDLALLHALPAGPARIVLLAEVKASPAAATPDFARLHRGLLRLAHADPTQHYAFQAGEGPVAIAGASLAALGPAGRTLPPQVIYCCTAPAESRVAMLAAPARAVLLAEPECLAFARALAGGAALRPEHLAPVWEALAQAPRLRSALHQYDSARQVREAMLHPGDILQAFADDPGGNPPHPGHTGAAGA